MLMTLKYGNGRVFHTVLGHADYSMNSVGFINTLQRGAEWAATGEVTIPVPEDFPTANESRSRE
jgi:type 1 glutamine amidotransferase